METTDGVGSIADNPLLWMYNMVYGLSLVAVFVFFTARSVLLVKVSTLSAYHSIDLLMTWCCLDWLVDWFSDCLIA